MVLIIDELETKNGCGEETALILRAGLGNHMKQIYDIGHLTQMALYKIAWNSEINGLTHDNSKEKCRYFFNENVASLVKFYI